MIRPMLKDFGKVKLIFNNFSIQLYFKLQKTKDLSDIQYYTDTVQDKIFTDLGVTYNLL
jgi:hypothetical protein